jgi:hypothetical protein
LFLYFKKEGLKVRVRKRENPSASDLGSPVRKNSGKTKKPEGLRKHN